MYLILADGSQPPWLHVNDFNDDCLPPARMDDDMLLCFHTTAANASDVLPQLTSTQELQEYPRPH
eukprot:5119370-Pleurochrysis_carterae.AAC.2